MKLLWEGLRSPFRELCMGTDHERPMATSRLLAQLTVDADTYIVRNMTYGDMRAIVADMDRRTAVDGVVLVRIASQLVARHAPDDVDFMHLHPQDPVPVGWDDQGIQLMPYHGNQLLLTSGTPCAEMQD